MPYLPANPAAPPRTAPGRRISWLGVAGFALMVALLAVALVQARQYSLTRLAVEAGGEGGALTVYQAETEYLRLREAWREASDPGAGPEALAALARQHGAWVARVRTLRQPGLQDLLGQDPGWQDRVAEIESFVERAGPALARPAGDPEIRHRLAELGPALDALAPALREVTQLAATRMATRLRERADAIQAQNRLGLGLTLFLSVLTLAFAAVAWRQLSALRERRLVLEDLAANLRQARREAESASEAKSAFLANMSHEIRTPFQGLMGMLSLLRESGLAPRQIDLLRTATESADHLLALLNDILDMSQLDSGRLTLAPSAVELRALLREVEALMRPQAGARQLALHIDAEPSVPERVLADATRIKQILFNLLANAIKFCDRGSVMLDLRAQPLDGGRQLLRFVVTDTGVGMDEATLSGLFNRFMQGDPSRSRRHGGSGLGLEISRNLARLMGGDITARSRPGEGSVFTFEVPLPVLGPAVAVPPPEALGEAPAARSLRVLVAEDHPINRQYLAALLGAAGHRAHFAANGEEAVAAARAEFFDLVLMDLHMPEMDGVAATRAIRGLGDPRRSTLPIVALTADAFPETRERCLVAGMNDFLTKPVSPAQLATSLRRLFGSTEATESAPPPVPPGTVLPSVQAASAPALVDGAAIRACLLAMAPAQLGALIGGFLELAPQTVQRLRAAVRDGQPLELRVNAHAAKGAALNLGLTGLAATAQALQEGAAHLPAHEIARLVQRFEDQLEATRQAVRALGLPIEAGPRPDAAPQAG